MVPNAKKYTCFYCQRHTEFKQFINAKKENLKALTGFDTSFPNMFSIFLFRKTFADGFGLSLGFTVVETPVLYAFSSELCNAGEEELTKIENAERLQSKTKFTLISARKFKN